MDNWFRTPRGGSGSGSWHPSSSGSFAPHSGRAPRPTLPPLGSAETGPGVHVGAGPAGATSSPLNSASLTTAQRILDLAPLIPAGGALTGWAAAYVHGVDLLDGRDPESMDPLPITINLGRDLGRAHTDRVCYRRDHLPTRDRLTCHGLAITTPQRAAFDGTRFANDLAEAVAFLDQITHVLPVTLAELADRGAPGGRWAGLPLFQRALALADPAAANPWESRLRIFAMLRAGLPRPLVNQPVFDLEENFLGTPDLLDPESGLVLEFDGQDHRRRLQHRADNIREEKLEVVNLTVCRVDSLDLRQPVPLIQRLRARHAQGMARDRSRDRWTHRAATVVAPASSHRTTRQPAGLSGAVGSPYAAADLGKLEAHDTLRHVGADQPHLGTLTQRQVGPLHLRRHCWFGDHHGAPVALAVDIDHRARRRPRRRGP